MTSGIRDVAELQWLYYAFSIGDVDGLLVKHECLTLWEGQSDCAPIISDI